jgi:hypothetical protein
VLLPKSLADDGGHLEEVVKTSARGLLRSGGGFMKRPRAGIHLLHNIFKNIFKNSRLR